jgi:hypothetical protein
MEVPSSNKSFLDNPYVLGSLTIFVFAYASKSQVDIPDVFTDLFRNDIFRVLFLSLLLMLRFQKSPSVSILVSLFFVFIMGKIMSQETLENFKSIKSRKHRSVTQ